MRRQKIISMTDAHFEAASKMKNFSGWVREQLEKYIQDEKNRLKMMATYVCNKCNIEFQKGPVTDRVRGTRFKTYAYCPEAGCGAECQRWDLL